MKRATENETRHERRSGSISRNSLDDTVALHGWSDVEFNEQRQNKRRKPDEKAYQSLKGIISDRELRVGQYKEVVNVIVPERKGYDAKTKKFSVERDVPVKPRRQFVVWRTYQ